MGGGEEKKGKGEYTYPSCALILKLLIAVFAILSGGKTTVPILKYLRTESHVQLIDISPLLISNTSIGCYISRVITIL